MNNDPQGAAALFETALSESPVNPDIYIYLPLAYYQLGEYDKSLEISNIGLSTEGTNRHIIAFNAGNTAFAAGDYINASIYYTMAIEADAQYAAPVLNRANTYMKLDKLEDAVRDYTKYLTLEPITPQRRQILDLIQLLNGEIALRKQSQNTVSAGAAAAAGTAAGAAAAGAAAG
ncbi:MAG TPA: tetratricopeptide repeat protein, partial [Candidatus Treponema faecavium]|nr:tetratricopeptide repeat protein [Candidatus Treponema faecavium]